MTVDGNQNYRQTYSQYMQVEDGTSMSEVCRWKPDGSGSCRTLRALRVQQPSVLNEFFSELQYSPAFGRENRKFAGGVSKYAKFRHFLAHTVV